MSGSPLSNLIELITINSSAHPPEKSIIIINIITIIIIYMCIEQQIMINYGEPLLVLASLCSEVDSCYVEAMMMQC